jgi:hypothetical protein
MDKITVFVSHLRKTVIFFGYKNGFRLITLDYFKDYFFYVKSGIKF